MAAPTSALSQTMSFIPYLSTIFGMRFWLSAMMMHMQSWRLSRIGRIPARQILKAPSLWSWHCNSSLSDSCTLNPQQRDPRPFLLSMESLPLLRLFHQQMALYPTWLPSSACLMLPHGEFVILRISSSVIEPTLTEKRTAMIIGLPRRRSMHSCTRMSMTSGL